MNNKIREERKNRGLSLKELSGILSIPYSSLSQYERGERQPKNAVWEKLANFFEVSIPYIMGLSSERNDSAAENSKKLAEHLAQSKEIDDIAETMKIIIKNGDAELAKKIVGIIGEFALMLSHIVEENISHREANLEIISNIVYSLYKITSGGIMLDIPKYQDIVKKGAKSDGYEGLTVEEVRALEEKRLVIYPIKPIDKAFSDYNAELQQINSNIDNYFSIFLNTFYTYNTKP